MDKPSPFLFSFRLWFAAFFIGFTFGVIATNFAHRINPNGYKIQISQRVAK